MGFEDEHEHEHEQRRARGAVPRRRGGNNDCASFKTGCVI